MKIKACILAGFFLTICVVLIWKYTYHTTQETLIKRSLSDQALSLFDDSLKSLTESQIQAQQDEIANRRAELAERKAEIDARITLIPVKVQVKRWSYYATPVVLSVCLIVISVGLSVGIVRQRSVFFAKLDAQTEIPIKYSDLATLGPAIMGAVEVRLQEALTGNQEDVRSQVHAMLADFAMLAKSIGGRRGLTALPDPTTAPVDLPKDNPPPDRHPIPPFRMIVEHLQPGDPMVLGYDLHTGEPLTGGFEKLYSSFIAGKSGTGKSSWLRALILQSLKCYPGIIFYVLDPHANHAQSFSQSLPRTANFQYLDAGSPIKGIYQFNRVLQERLETPDEYSPAVFVVDELAYCSRQKYALPLQTLLERISNEGRKAGCYLLASSQDVRLRKTGDFKDVITSAYLFNLKSGMVRTFLQDKEETVKHGEVRALNQKGIALFYPTEEESRVVKVPFCTAQDVRELTLNTLLEQPEHPLNSEGEHHANERPVHVLFKHQMETLNISLNTLAKVADVPKSSLSNYLNGRGGLSAPQQQRLEDQLNTLSKQHEQPRSIQ